MAQLTTDNTQTTWEQGWTRGKSLLQRQGALIALVILVLFGSFRYTGFLDSYNIYNFLTYNTMFALISLGMTFVIMTGGIDLSVGSVVALASVVAARFSNYGLGAAMLAAILTGVLIGLINGLAVTWLRILPFIATLAMLLAARGLALVFSGDASIPVNTNTDFISVWTNTVLNIPIPIYFLIIAYALGLILHHFTRFGRHVLAIGGNEEAARLMGLPVDRIKLLVYVISGGLAGLAGVFLAAQTNTGSPNEGVGWELTAIASVVVGGTLLTGGMGSVFATLIGSLLLGLVFNILNFENGYGLISLSVYWQSVIRGTFLLIVVLLQSRLARQKANT